MFINAKPSFIQDEQIDLPLDILMIQESLDDLNSDEDNSNEDDTNPLTFSPKNDTKKFVQKIRNQINTNRIKNE